MKELIKTLLGDIVRKIAPNFKGRILVDIAENKEFGDYTTNVAFSLGKVLKKSPQSMAEELVKKIKSAEFSRIEAKNGFINFFLSEECLQHQLKEILKPSFGRLQRPSKGKYIQIEFISANPTGPLTIGNGRGGFFGDVLANVLESQGNKVVREYYINDRGGQILALGRSIKLAQGFTKSGNLDFVNPLTSISEINQDLYRGDYVKDLAKQINKNLSIEEAGQKAVELVLKTYIKPVIKKLGIKFDVWFSEKSLYPSSLKLRRASKGDYEKTMENLMQKDLIYEKDGATWMKTSKLGDDEDRVLIKKNGDETYFMSDILYHLDKFNKRKFDKVVNIWGTDHHGDIPRLTGALKALGVDLNHLYIILTQFVRLISGGKEVKISKRAGTFITLEELVDEVGLDAARFFFLMYSPNTHMDFDMALAKERSQKNPVYYVQYAHARLCAILRKSQIPKSKFQTKSKTQIPNIKLLKTKDELNLIRKLVEYPEILAEIARTYGVHRLPRYALELAREFHNFYEKEKVITEDKKLTSARLALIMATKIVLANSLNLMGIAAPERM